ncbi:hypothetical protein JKP88DRAFT_285080 [Tribonema minus]|uniref:Autophagy-related protein 101 n=1 Tax=Tribonema minus TaxID=303371 RepID=A0A835ZG30_9STRA|nr:hypothetical protein JKP88DRAFT_285080 [Tribonema minus]
MNLKEHVLEEVELHESHVRDALQCLLHTILFVRAPGPLRPREAHCDYFDLTYARYAPTWNRHLPTDSNRVLTVLVNRHLPTDSNRVLTVLVVRAHDPQHQPLKPLVKDLLAACWPDLSKGWVTLSFFERRIKKTMFGLMSNEEKIAWEQWVVPVLVSGAPLPTGADEASELARQRLKEHTEEALAARIEDVVSFANGPINCMPFANDPINHMPPAFFANGPIDHMPPAFANGPIDHMPPVMYEFEIACAQRGERRDSMYSRVMQAPNPLAL